MMEGIVDDGTDVVVPSSNWIRYCGEMAGSIGISMTVPVRVVSSSRISTRVPGGYGSLISGTSLRCSDTNKPPS